MTMKDKLVRVGIQIQPLLPCVYWVIGATLVLVILVTVMNRRVWMNRRRFRWLGLFLDMSPFNTLQLAASWVRMWVCMVLVCQFSLLTVSQYLLFLCCALLFVISSKGPVEFINKLFWAVLQFMGLLSTSLICGYLVALEAPMAHWVLYGALCTFMVLFSIYLFLTELNTVSLGRKARLEEQITGAYREEAGA